jgi:hypothetical protein
MSMMCPPHRVKITSIPSAFSAFATKWPPEIISGSRTVSEGVLSGAVLVITVLSNLAA